MSRPPKPLQRETKPSTGGPVYGEKEAGCWFDCCRGIYIGDAVIREAIGHDFVCDVEPRDTTGYEPGPTTWTDYEHYHELADEAEEFMHQFAAEGYWFGYSEGGDWGLWAIEEE